MIIFLIAACVGGMAIGYFLLPKLLSKAEVKLAAELPKAS